MKEKRGSKVVELSCVYAWHGSGKTPPSVIVEGKGFMMQYGDSQGFYLQGSYTAQQASYSHHERYVYRSSHVCVCAWVRACVCALVRVASHLWSDLSFSLFSLSLSLSLSLARSLSLSLALSLSLSLSPPPHPPTHPPSPTPPPPSDRHYLTLSRGSTRALSEMTTRAASTGPRTSRAGRRTRMARTTTCCLSRFCAATRSRPARSGKASTLATAKASSARSMTVWREAPTGP